MPTEGRSCSLGAMRRGRGSFAGSAACPLGLVAQVYRDVTRRGLLPARHAADFDLCGSASSGLAHVHPDRQELDFLQQVDGNIT